MDIVDWFIIEGYEYDKVRGWFYEHKRKNKEEHEVGNIARNHQTLISLIIAQSTGNNKSIIR